MSLELIRHARTAAAWFWLWIFIAPGALPVEKNPRNFKINLCEYAWPENLDRVWVGPGLWANRLQDWCVKAGRLECTASMPMRTVHLLTRHLGGGEGGFTLQVRTGPLSEVQAESAAGFLVGAGPTLDYRGAALIHHSPGPDGGLFAGVDGTGALFFRDFGDQAFPEISRMETGEKAAETVLRLTAKQEETGYTLSLIRLDSGLGAELGRVTLKGVEPERLVGNMALVSHSGPDKSQGRYWFRDLSVSGRKLERRDQRTGGPILSTQYTLSRGILKMTTQLMPLGTGDGKTVVLEVQENGKWIPAATTEIIEPGYTATFRVADWNDRRNIPYRVVYCLKTATGGTETCSWSGTVRRNPLEKETVVLAAFTGNHNVGHPGADRGKYAWTWENVWFPHTDLTQRVAAQDPDLLFFSGDQVYEGASPTRADHSGKEASYFDYLYKWYLWCWAYRDLAREIPCVSIPDDHDVYHGNIWGAGGRHADRQDEGGYRMPPEFVRMVERTQTANLPDPFDPEPVEQDIGVYFCALNWGGISFAVLEDRKFKSSPTVMVPEGKVVNGWFQNKEFNPLKSDVPGAKLLGERQLAFLRFWSADWSHGAVMKAALSQTVFSNVATLPAEALSDGVVPRLKIMPPGDYAEGDKLAADSDSNGWPASGRNRAIRELRRGFALHVAGDQHLGSTIQYGVDEYGDAGYAICVPSVANFWPRRWFPPMSGGNRSPGAPRYTGDYLDGFGNHMTVFAVSNPEHTGKEPVKLHDRQPGYGIVKFDKGTRMISLACWPRWVNPSDPDAKPYPGWPVTCHMLDNYGRKATACLPTLQVTGLPDPVVQVIRESDGTIVYTLRIQGESFQPKVFEAGQYTVRVGDPDKGIWKTIEGLAAEGLEKEGMLEVRF